MYCGLPHEVRFRSFGLNFSKLHLFVFFCPRIRSIMRSASSFALLVGKSFWFDMQKSCQDKMFRKFNFAVSSWLLEDRKVLDFITRHFHMTDVIALLLGSHKTVIEWHYFRSCEFSVSFPWNTTRCILRRLRFESRFAAETSTCLAGRSQWRDIVWKWLSMSRVSIKEDA